MKKKNFITVTLVAVFVFGLFMWNLFGKTSDFSETERRTLAKFPKITLENMLSGRFAKDFEKYATDHFPMRDAWRMIKTYSKTRVFAQKDNHGIYEAEGHIVKLDDSMNTKMLDHAIEIFQKVERQYLEDNKVYLSIIPDKNYYLAKRNGYLSLDYEKLITYMQKGMNYAKYIAIEDLLEAEDYYYTDSHWKQEQIIDVAQRLTEEMGVVIQTEYQSKELDVPFYGVYVGQSALSHVPDTITYLVNETIEKVEVDGATAVYDMKKANGRDPYEMFLSGNQSVVTLKNPTNTVGKRLIVFRDSFGSSIAPLFVQGYSEIVLVDLRHISSDLLGEFVNFEGADVLFLYSTLLLNNSLVLK